MASVLDNLLDSVRRKKVVSTKSVGAPGTAIYGGYIQDNEKNSQLTGRQKYLTYSNVLANTAIVAAGTRYFLNLIAKAQWRVQPADETEQAKGYADELEKMMYEMTTPWHRVIRRASMHRFYGFSIQEWTAKKREDGVLTIMDIEPRAQITITKWDTDESGTVLGVVQTSPQTQDEIYLPRSKLIYIVDDTLNDSPEGLGIFRHIVSSAQRLSRFEQLEGFGFETDLRGVPIGRGPFSELEAQVQNGEITAADKANAIAPLTNFIQNHIKNPQLGMLLDSITYQSMDEAGTPSSVKQWDMELLKGGTTSQAEVAATIERLNREIARLLGVEGMLLGGSNGTQALSVDKSKNLAMIIDGVLLELVETFEKDFRDVIWKLNGWPEEMKPTFKTEATQFRDVEQITTALKDLAVAGSPVTLGDPVVNEVRDLLGLSNEPENLVEQARLENELDASLLANSMRSPSLNNKADQLPENSENENEDSV